MIFSSCIVIMLCIVTGFVFLRFDTERQSELDLLIGHHYADPFRHKYDFSPVMAYIFSVLFLF